MREFHMLILIHGKDACANLLIAEDSQVSQAIFPLNMTL